MIPPVEMLIDGSSSAQQFVDFGEGCVHHILIPRAGLQPSDAFFDLGCGNGSVARALTSYLQPPGSYEGLDIHGGSVAWLKEHYQSRPLFRFTHANVYNKMYNPDATVGAADTACRMPTVRLAWRCSSRSSHTCTRTTFGTT